MFRVKICGITTLTDLELAFRLGADAVGFNFYRVSRRYLDPSRCREIIREFFGEMTFIGVFVNEDAEVINEIAEYTGIDGVQLSGDESRDLTQAVEKETIKVVRPLTPAHVKRAGEYPSDWIMFDTFHPSLYGGSGKRFSHELLLEDQLDRPFLIAGGLNGENVKDVIRRVKPYGVDVASGVEDDKGMKDPEKMEKFIKESREAFSIEKRSEE